MEMYIGSVERIAFYAESDESSAMTETTTTTTNIVRNSINNNKEKSNEDDGEEGMGGEKKTSLPLDVGGSGPSVVKVYKNDKLFGLNEISKEATTSAAPTTTTTTGASTYSKSVNKTVANIQQNVGVTLHETDDDDDNDDDTFEKFPKKPMGLKETLKKTSVSTADNDNYHNNNDNDDEHENVQQQQEQQQHIVANDGHVAITTTKTLAHKQTTDEAIQPGAAATSAAVATSQLPLLSLAGTKDIHHHCSTTQSNDAERRASVRGLDWANKNNSNNKRYIPVAISWPQRGDISFENVSLRYEGQQEDVIKNLNLHIPAGQRIGICGRTGSGKSSLALSLFGVLQVTEGHIYIDDMDISHIHPDEVRTRLSIIPQDVHLFAMTIRENLDPSGYYSDFELWNCLELAQLKDFVNMKMPQGLDTEIMDGGLNLSVGHRQLFCLARAILRGSVCLVLDEATSALDTTTEKALLSAAHKAFQGRTIITIAHRLSTILDYDRIIVLDKGEILEDGDPNELKNRPNGIFASYLKSGRPLSSLSNTGEIIQSAI